jgi:hypothetical protein
MRNNGTAAGSILSPKKQAPRETLSRGARLPDFAYLFSLVWPMISWAVKLMWQVGNEFPTKKLSDCLE